ncbi:MCE family protein [[Mycobacterium] vasticus]|uniref:MlaD family protein n=1 Tax=[Mycobacterium] vasticus TaxID=2875777 RepID=A0ABU5Z2P0_9MYCO|nr:MlaD family protein [Mycolicibacter sp. MYC017]MEB3071665.1 MlaD family protein [Mycolicibacter sp. MYC017]
MLLTRRIRIQLAIFGAVAVIGLLVLSLGYMGLPNLFFGIGHYTVKLELPETGGLYKSGNVTYRGVEVGRVKDLRLTGNGVEAVLSLRSDIKIPSDVDAEVHSQSAVGEQYVALLPRGGDAHPLREGDIIARENISVPPDINVLLNETISGLQAIPRDELKTVIDEGYIAFGGLGPDLARFVKGANSLAIDARKNLASITALIDKSKPVLDTQTDTSDSVQAWAAHLADITQQLKANDTAVRGVLQQGSSAADESTRLFDRLQPSLPVAMNNLAPITRLLMDYYPAVEELLTIVPQATSWNAGASVPDLHIKSPYRGIWAWFNLNMNLPPACTTGYLPASQIRTPSMVDTPPRPVEDLYCRIPQDSDFNVRGVRNTPCMKKPGKRAPTAKMCNSDLEYVPLNEGFNWKGDPNATVTGQGIPEAPPGMPDPWATPPPTAAAAYDPTTRTYMGPDGNLYSQTDLTHSVREDQTWQTMLLPPPNG